jgi:hypothetical protein
MNNGCRLKQVILFSSDELLLIGKKTTLSYWVIMRFVMMVR